MKLKNLLRALVATMTMVVLLASFGAAQTTRGTIAGVVTDNSGAAVAGAKVTATPVEGGEPRAATTGGTGEYRIEQLTPGTFNVAIAADGFANKKVDNVIVRTSVITSNNVTLAVAGSSETVTVEAAADSIQTESGELSKTIATTAIQNLPYVSQNPYSLATTLPGVSTVVTRDDFTNGTSFSVNGLRPRSNNFLIDGFDNNDYGIAGQAFQPNNTEAVQEVTVLSNAYAAEFGRGGGSVSNLSFRSGGNQLHGALWEQYSGAGLDAIKSEDSALNGLTTVPQYVNNVFGFRVGGPVIKNKLYFFGTSQWNRFFGDPGAAQLQIPTAAGFNLLNQLAQAGNTNAQLLLQPLGNLRAAIPVGTIPIGDRTGICTGCAVEYGFFRRTDKGSTLSREWTGRVDYTGATDNLYVRYTDSRNDGNPDLFANSGALPSQDTKQGGPSRLLGAMWAHTFNPHLLNEFRFSAQQIDFKFEATDVALNSPTAQLPTVTLASSLSFFWGGYSQAGFPQGRGHKTFQFQDAVSWTAGKHNIKIGADLAVLLVKDIIPFNAQGLLNVAGGGVCSYGDCTDLNNYLDGFAGPGGAFSKSFGNPIQNVATSQQAYYFQDSFRLKPNLTLDFGVRYEYQPHDALDGLQFPAIDRAKFATDGLLVRREAKADRNNFAPRFGFAYTPNFWKGLFGEQKTVLRGGYGMFYDAFFTNISNNVASSSPNTSGFSVNPCDPDVCDRGPANPLATIAAATGTLSPLTAISSVDSNFRNPLIHQWNFNVQRELPLQMKAEVAYVGTRGERLWVNEQLNPKNPLTGIREVSTRGSIVVRSNRGDSVYHGLQTSLTRNIGFLQVRGSYTWSKAIDNQSEVFATTGGSSRWQNVKDPRSDRGVSAFDRTHRAAISYNLAPPSPWKRGFMGAIFNGWGTSGVLSFQSGAPETIFFGGSDQNGDGESFNDRPTLGNPAGTLLLGKTTDGTTFRDWNTNVIMPRDTFRYLFIKGQNGNVGRNSFRYPGTINFDASILKEFSMPYAEGHKVQLRMDMINAFNHPNLGVSGFDGDITSAATFLNVANTRRGGRQLFLWLKYEF